MNCPKWLSIGAFLLGGWIVGEDTEPNDLGDPAAEGT